MIWSLPASLVSNLTSFSCSSQTEPLGIYYPGGIPVPSSVPLSLFVTPSHPFVISQPLNYPLRHSLGSFLISFPVVPPTAAPTAVYHWVLSLSFVLLIFPLSQNTYHFVLCQHTFLSATRIYLFLFSSEPLVGPQKLFWFLCKEHTEDISSHKSPKKCDKFLTVCSCFYFCRVVFAPVFEKKFLLESPVVQLHAKFEKKKKDLVFIVSPKYWSFVLGRGTKQRLSDYLLTVVVPTSFCKLGWQWINTLILVCKGHWIHGTEALVVYDNKKGRTSSPLPSVFLRDSY